MLAEGRNEDELTDLDITVGMITNPENEAMAMLRTWQQQQGITFEDPPGA